MTCHASDAHALQLHTVLVYVPHTQLGVVQLLLCMLPTPGLIFKILAQIRWPSCIKLTSCARISLLANLPETVGGCGCVTITAVLWPEPFAKCGARCETWKWSLFATFSAVRLTWSCPSSTAPPSLEEPCDSFLLYTACLISTSARSHHDVACHIQPDTVAARRSARYESVQQTQLDHPAF